MEWGFIDAGGRVEKVRLSFVRDYEGALRHDGLSSNTLDSILCDQLDHKYNERKRDRVEVREASSHLC
jgi:hypothetical protein